MKSKIANIICFTVLLYTSIIFPQNRSYHILSSDASGITIEYDLNLSDSTLVNVNNSKYIKLSLLEGETFELKPGMPEISYVPVTLGVPSQTGSVIQVLSSEFKTINSPLAPIPDHKKNGDDNITEYIISNDYNSFNSTEDLVSFGDYGIQRGIPVQIFRIEPIKFNAQVGILKLYTKIIFRISYKGKPENIYIDNKDELIKNSLLNYDYVKSISTSKKLQLKKQTTNSVLSSGTWYKFEAPEEGIYKITKSMLQELGIDPNVDPRTIKIYNNGGKVLPENINTAVPNDLLENAIYVSGEDDGVFNDNDYILFYGRGVNFLEYANKTLSRTTNPYSFENYYFITSGGAAGKRMQTKPVVNDNPVLLQTTSLWMVFQEDDKINLNKSGRVFLGDEFNQTSKGRTYINKLDNLIPNSLSIKFRFVNSGQDKTELIVDQNSTNIFNAFINGTNDYNGIYREYSTGVSTTINKKFTNDLPDNRSVLKFTYNSQNASSIGYIDFYELSYTRSLIPVDNQLIFFSKDTTGVVEYDLSGFSNSNIRVFNVADFSNAAIVQPKLLSGGDFRFGAIESPGLSSKYIAIGDDNFKSISNISKVNNQNIHNAITDVQYLIITPTDFKDQANRYKTFRENSAKNKLSCGVFDIQEIYNEFSCGIKDPTALKNFIKYAYDNWNVKPEYVLLFGDGTYDYRNIEKYNNNFLPTYQVVYDFNSDFDDNLHQITSYSTDDYFVRVDGNDDIPDLALGRLTINSTTEANNVVDKIIYYETNNDYSNWRNLITLVADDGYAGTTYEGAEHTRPTELLATNYIPETFDLKKIYMAAYTPEITGGGKRIPQVTKDLVSTINDGTLILNYVGHGSPEVWAHEYVLEKNSFIPQLNNNRYCFLILATCDFGYFDNPSDQSGSELFILKKDAGAIGAFSSNRLVFSSDNHALMYQLYQNLLGTPKDSNSLTIPLGKAVFLTKGVKFSTNDQKFHLLCDPALRLDIPQYESSIDTINGLSLDNNTIQIKALSKVKITGTIRKNSKVWDDLNGEGVLTFYDSDRSQYLSEIAFTVTLPGGVIFNGRTSIVNGRFTTEFVVPKDISYANNKGKIVFYFNNNSADGIGYTRNIIVGGSDSSSQNDNKGPEIVVSFDGENNVNKQLVSPNSKLFIKLKDETGLNTTGNGIGHKLEGILNNDENNVLDFSNYFTGDLDAGGKSGKVVYPFNDMAKGRYELKVKAWDVYNNYSTESAYFEVVSDLEPVITDVYNYPNPFKENTVFTFQHSINKPVDIKINIYSVAGRLIRKIEKDFVSTGYITIPWDGKDQDGNNIANGVYLYKVIVNAVDGSVNKTALGKLAVIK